MHTLVYHTSLTSRPRTCRSQFPPPPSVTYLRWLVAVVTLATRCSSAELVAVATGGGGLWGWRWRRRWWWPGRRRGCCWTGGLLPRPPLLRSDWTLARWRAWRRWAEELWTGGETGRGGRGLERAVWMMWWWVSDRQRSNTVAAADHNRKRLFPKPITFIYNYFIIYISFCTFKLSNSFITFNFNKNYGKCEKSNDNFYFIITLFLFEKDKIIYKYI